MSQISTHPAVKVIAALAFILVILKLFTDMVPRYVGIASAILLLVILIMYKLFTTSSQ
jgi:hypothetical protein